MIGVLTFYLSMFGREELWLRLSVISWFFMVELSKLLFSMSSLAPLFKFKCMSPSLLLGDAPGTPTPLCLKGSLLNWRSWFSFFLCVVSPPPNPSSPPLGKEWRPGLLICDSSCLRSELFECVPPPPPWRAPWCAAASCCWTALTSFYAFLVSL